MIDSISSDFNIDSERIYACGMSNGGYMAYRLACDLSDKIAAFGSVTGNFMINNEMNDCLDQGRKIQIIHFHGTSDPIVNYYSPSFDEALTVEESISLSGISACVTGDGSMFRVHFSNTKPTTYRETYQEKEVRKIINELLDYLFLKENIIMINTCTCMFSTSTNQQHVDKLSEALLNGFKIIKPKLENIV